MIAIRAAKIVLVAAIALFASLVAFGNLTHYNTNFVFVQHVLSMDTVFPFSTITYRAITSPALHHTAYTLIIAAEITIAVLCWIGAYILVRNLRAKATTFNGAKTFAILGLTLGFLLWQVGFMAIGGEWVRHVAVAAMEWRAERVPLRRGHPRRVDLRGDAGCRDRSDIANRVPSFGTPRPSAVHRRLGGADL